MEESIIKGSGAGEWQRYWCVLDGSTLLCYSGEEVCVSSMCVCVYPGAIMCLCLCIYA